MQAAARMASVMSATSCARRRLIRDFGQRIEAFDMSVPTSDEADVLFRGRYSYRKPGAGVVGLMCILFFGSLLCLFARELFRPHSQSEILLGIGLCVFTGAFAWIGGILSYYYLTHHTKELVIDRSGVTYGGRLFPWTVIRTIKEHPKSTDLQLMLLRRGRFALMRPIWVDGGLSSAQYSRLMRDLRRMITPTHPHTHFD